MKKARHFSLDELLIKRKSVRKFKDTPISTENIMKLKDSARKAPSAGGIRPVSIYIIENRNPESELTKSVWRASSKQSVILRSKLIIVFCVDFNKIRRKYGSRGDRYAILEVGHMAQNVCLKAVDIGLATCCIGAFKDSKIKEILSCEEIPIYMIAVGSPKE